MRIAARICDIAYWLALSCWFATMAAAGIAAMNVFGTLPSAGVTLDEFEAYSRSEHGRLAAGIVMEGVFFTVDVIQFVACPVVVIAMLVQILALGDSMRRWSNIIRAVCIIAAAGLFAYHASSVAPTMNRHLHDYWSAAKAGDVDRAASERAAFNRLHPRAEAILRGNLMLLAVAIASSAVALRSSSNRDRANALQIPRLALQRP